MLKATLVSYLNTKPFLQGIEKFFTEDEILIQLLPPSDCAESLRRRECDIALVPAGALKDLPGVKLMKDHCIGAFGKVNSVFLLANEPIESLNSILSDPHSRTSNLLAAVLARFHWYKKVNWLSEEPVDEKGLGRIMIGDKAMQVQDKYKFVIDLSEEWKKWTGLPFVFAVWAYYPDAISPESLEKFRISLQDGINRLPEAAERFGPEFGLSTEAALEYLSGNLRFAFDDQMHKGFNRFLDEVGRVLVILP